MAPPLWFPMPIAPHHFQAITICMDGPFKLNELKRISFYHRKKLTKIKIFNLQYVEIT
jgi:hypothetical protein